MSNFKFWKWFGCVMVVCASMLLGIFLSAIIIGVIMLGIYYSPLVAIIIAVISLILIASTAMYLDCFH